MAITPTSWSNQTSGSHEIFFFFLTVFYLSSDASLAENLFLYDTQSITLAPFRWLWGSRIRTRDSCILCLVSPSCLSQLSHHIPRFYYGAINAMDNQCIISALFITINAYFYEVWAQYSISMALLTPAVGVRALI
jgi:hypothetical protein